MDKNEITYASCGIENVEEFYKTKFAYNHTYDIHNKSNYEFNIQNLKQLYIYDYISRNSKVLDFGCGSGTFKILKNLGCELVGVDYSKEALEYAKKYNDYDIVSSLDIFDSFYDKYIGYFDHIITLDLFGHIEFREKNILIKRLKSLLKPTGSMCHGIETGDIDYTGMNQDQRKAFVEIDGHVGIESQKDTKERFKDFFKHVHIYTPYGLLNDMSEIIKQSKSYESSHLEPKLVELLETKSQEAIFSEAFNISQYCTHKFYEKYLSKDSYHDFYGFSFLICSDNEIKKYNHKKPQNPLQFSNHFYTQENIKKVIVRWSPVYSYITLNGVDGISLKLSSIAPLYTKKPMTLIVKAEGEIDAKIYFDEICNTYIYRWHNKKKLKTAKIEFYADTNFTPSLYDKNSSDKRNLSFQISLQALQIRKGK